MCPREGSKEATHKFSIGEAQKINELVKSVQIHKHKKNGCLKKNGQCRFNFPKPPSEKNIITKPLPLDMPQEEKEKKISNAKKILEKTKKLLNDLNEDQAENMTFQEFLDTIEVHEDEYYEALRIAVDGQTVILKRKINERFVNSYRPLFLLKWQANIDVQLVSIQQFFL